jgi:hypothetical protein
MKLALRALVLCVFAAGASAAVVTSHSANSMTAAVPSHQVASASLPVPVCTPDVPGCPPGK